MQKILLMAVATLFISTGMAFATPGAAGGSGVHDPFTCEKNDDGDFECYCAGEGDCQAMQDSGVCDLPFPQGGSQATSNDTDCDTNFGGVGEHVCHCTATSTAPNISRRPDAFDPANENAPTEPNVRDHRSSRRGPSSADDIVAPNNRTTDEGSRARRSRPAMGTITDGSSNTINMGERRSRENADEADEVPTNEVVPARRGNAPDPESTQEDEDENATSTRRVRDHR